MRFILALAALLACGACSPAEKPAAIASSADIATASVTVAAQSEAESLGRASISIEPASASASASGTCLSEIGKTASDRLVKRCLMVSPATHPPCNAANSCQMIQDEIDRSCAMYGAGEKKPAECTA